MWAKNSSSFCALLRMRASSASECSMSRTVICNGNLHESFLFSWGQPTQDIASGRPRVEAMRRIDNRGAHAARQRGGDAAQRAVDGHLEQRLVVLRTQVRQDAGHLFGGLRRQLPERGLGVGTLDLAARRDPAPASVRIEP